MFKKIRSSFGEGLRSFYLIVREFGLDPVVMLRSLQGLPRYVGGLLCFRAGYHGRLTLFPCLHDWREEGGSTTQEYFWQDLLVAQMISAANPKKHVDVGSRVDGFIAHVASFREIEVFDVRPISTRMPGIVFKQADLMKPLTGMAGYCDSLSCLHSLEHFGLGRYSDPISASGYEQGISNMAALLKHGGVFYLSVPIGLARVEFNAHRVFDPRVIIDLAMKNRLRLSALTIIRLGGIVENVELNSVAYDALAREKYLLGIFKFFKDDLLFGN